MSPQVAIDLFRQALFQTLWISLPLLAIGIIAGVAVSILQILTSIQDTSFGTVPRLAAFLFALLLLLPWMTARLIAYTVALFSDFGRYAH